MSSSTPLSIPTMKVVGLSASDQRQSAIQNMNTKADLLNALNQSGGLIRRKGRKTKKRNFKIRGGNIVVPLPTPMYSDTLAGDQSSSGQIIGNAVTMTTSAENAKYDSLAASPRPIPANQLKGGRKDRTKKSRKIKKSKKNKKLRKSRKSRK